MGKGCGALEVQEVSGDTCKVSLCAHLHLQEHEKMLCRGAGVPAGVSAAFEQCKKCVLRYPFCNDSCLFKAIGLNNYS